MYMHTVILQYENTVFKLHSIMADWPYNYELPFSEHLKIVCAVFRLCTVLSHAIGWSGYIHVHVHCFFKINIILCSYLLDHFYISI